MKLWPLFSIFLFTPLSALWGQDVVSSREKGEAALADGLWEVAEIRFRESLASPALAADEKAKLGVLLAETLVRSGRSIEAFECLNLSSVAPHPEADFWKAQALSSMGKLSEAVGIFSKILENPQATHHAEAGFSKANIQLALGQADQAMATLETLATTSSKEVSSHAKLLITQIHLQANQLAEAKSTMPEAQEIAINDKLFAAFLQAHVALADGNFANAAAGFQVLVSQPQGQSRARYHASVLGLADSLFAGGNAEEATVSLLNFIRSNPDSPVIAEIFERLLRWLPASPTATDPILEQLAEWIPAPEFPALGVIAASSPSSDSAAAASWPISSRMSELQIFSMFTSAVGLHRLATPDSLAKSNTLMARLRLENPGHPLADRSLLVSARWLLETGRSDRAFAILDALRENAARDSIRGSAAFIAASAAYQNGNPEIAAKLFDEAARELPDASAKSAKLDAGLARLRSGDLPGVTLIQQSEANDHSSQISADLELETALVRESPKEKIAQLAEFLTDFPAHPRAAEARLAMAEAALTDSPPDLALVASQLELLDSAVGPTNAPAPARVSLIRLRAADISNNPEAAIQIARGILEKFPLDPVASEAALTLGRNLYLTKDYNPARLVLEKLAATDSDPGRAQVAWLLAARSAALVGTLSSKEEALVLFDKAIAQGGPLVSIARMEKADHLIKNMYRFTEAAGFLRKWFDSLPPTDALRLPAGLLLGQALYAEGSTSPNSLKEALAIYNQLLPHAGEHPALVHRLQYLRGLVLEQLPDEKDPSKKRESQAFIAFYSVLETTTPPVEWEYFELCGFKALSLLEKAGRWPAAVATAEKIASFKGPRAEEAATRASQLQLEHFMFED